MARVRAEGLRYVFVGEHHAVGPVKRFAVELANALAADGTEVGLYVEGFRSGCVPGDAGCASLARAFNAPAFAALLAESKVRVTAIDPPQREGRVERMAETIAAGRERVRVVLAGNTHVAFARRANDQGVEPVEWLVFGSMRYPSPGDLARAFPPAESVMIGLELAERTDTPYALASDGCGFDYVLTTRDSLDYWDSGGPVKPSGAAPATLGSGR